VGPFDESYFVSFATLAEIVAFCRSTAAPAQTAPVGARPMQHDCPGDLPPDRVSAFLLQLAPGARLQDVKFALAQLPDVKVVEGNGVITASRQALGTLIAGIAAFTVLELLALLILVSLLFSAIVQERRRELGLLRAIGAQADQAMAVVLAEAAIVTGAGGLAGIAFGTAVLLAFARSLAFAFGLAAFAWPPLPVLMASGFAALALAALLGLAGAWLPAWRLRRLSPHDLIQAELA
jgi:putative ABC transport system permease protein